MRENKRLSNKVALITGAGRGIGKAIALAFAKEGAIVAGADINSSHECEFIEAVEKVGGKALYNTVNVANSDDVSEWMKAISSKLNQIDILVNNAAVQMYGKDAKCHELDEEIWDQTMNVNLRGSWLCMKHAIPYMMDNEQGSIINMASPTGLKGQGVNFTAYSASKGGVIALTRVAAVGYGPSNIRVNAIVPGATNTPLIGQMIDDQPELKQRLEGAPLRRIGEPEDIVAMAVFLASDESAFCTGSLYMVDGGWTAM